MKNDWKQIFPFEITAIDILLEPDATMLEHCKADNARLLGVYPKGLALARPFFGCRAVLDSQPNYLWR